MIIENNLTGARKNVASGNYSHAEGFHTTASGVDSHAECGDTIASGSDSHAEGLMTQATGNNSHSEGNQTQAKGLNSHAEGYCTIAARKSQHVFGEFNIQETGSATERGEYVEIVGNGYMGNRVVASNARTLDWSGNEKIAGSLTIGMGTDDEATITPSQLKALLLLLN